jgi:Domain of unknown function (DUF1996)
MRIRRPAVLLAVCLSVMLAAFGLNVVSSGAASRTPSSRAAAMRRARHPARFVTRCNFSHTLSDDPIVKPNQPGASHSHDFFGNVTTNAATTLATLDAGGTTCIDRMDHSGYWVPSLTVNGAVVQPTFANVYYQNAGKPFRTIKTIPHGLEIVAGDAMATTPQSLNIVSWNCGAEEEDVAMSSNAPTCPSPTLTIHVNFPDCWNGTNLDSLDHKSHLAYHNANGTCPAGFPVPIPRVRVNVHYPTTGGPGVALASGGQYSGHADFFNAWVPKEIQRLVRTCINAGRVCKAQRR